MDHGLTRVVLECEHFLPLHEEEFAAAREAKESLIAALGIEEKLNLVLENYVEYEHELLQVTLEHALFSVRTWSDFMDVIHQINRRLINLLSTTKLYLDQVRHDTGRLLGSSSPNREAIETQVSAEYDARLGYRVMEALRNHVQHRGLPLHSITLGGKWDDTPEGRRRTERTVLYLNVATLVEDDRFKKAVIAELTADHDEKVALKPLVREYMTGIIRIHQRVRDELAPRVAEWDSCLYVLLQRYRAEAEDDVIGLSAVARTAEGTYFNEIAIFEDFIERRKWLEQKNRGAGELNKLIVSSE